MQAEILSIGSEITSGATLDTNSRWLSQQLRMLGISVAFHATLADDREAICNQIAQSAGRADLLLITGGLGPTRDDLTKVALADFLQVQLQLHQPSLEHIEAMFKKRNRKMTENNIAQAMIPAGCEVLDNPLGTATGVFVYVTRVGDASCMIAVMPGVPSEMKPMFQLQVQPRLSNNSQVIRTAKVNMFGIGESAAEEQLGELTTRGRNPEVGITASKATISLRITALGSSEAACETEIAETKAYIQQRMPKYIFGEGDAELQDIVIRQLIASHETLSIVETGTGGLLATLLSSVPESEQVFQSGFVLPTETGLQEFLETDELQHLVNSNAFAEQLAQTCRDKTGSSYAIAIAGFPLRETDYSNQSAACYYIAVAGPNISSSEQQYLTADTAIANIRAAKAGLNLLRLQLGNR